jgi:hypothetical protein
MDPRFLDLALTVIALEGIVLIAWRRIKGEGPKPGALIANLAAGALLLVAAREGLAGASALWTGAALAGALVAHGFDIAARWERKT